MKQSRMVSLIESLMNTALGFVISYLGWPIAASISGIEYSGGQHVFVVCFFTVLSVIRGYLVRRFFNAGLHTAAVKIANGLGRPL